MGTPGDPVIDPLTAKLRALGYVLDAGDRWIHPRIGLALPKPELLEACDPAEVEAFHDPTLWSDGERGPPPPPLSPDLLRVLNAHELEWDGWVGAWLGPREVPFTPEDVDRLGPEGIDGLFERFGAWRSAQGLRTLLSCTGMGVMFTWLVTGWQWGADVWLAGMAAVALFSWLWRPRSMPDDLWDGLDLKLLDQAEEDAQELLPEAWRTLAHELEAVPTPDGRLHLRGLNRTISLDTLTERFTPDGLGELLEILVHTEDLPEV